MECGIKAYPAVATAQTSIETLGLLAKEHGFTHEDIQEINLGVAVRAIEHGGAIVQPTDVSSAQFCIPFSVALQAVLGSNDVFHYTDSALWRDERILNIAKRVTYTPDETAVSDTRHSCRMTVTLKDGATFKKHTPYPRGSFLNPLTAKEAQAKFAVMATRVVGEARVKELIQAVDEIESLQDVTTIADLLCLPKAKH